MTDDPRDILRAEVERLKWQRDEAAYLLSELEVRLESHHLLGAARLPDEWRTYLDRRWDELHS